MNTKLLSLIALTSLLAAGCGGGGSSSNSSPLPTTPPPAPAPTPTPSKLAAYLGTWEAACDGHELAIITVTETPNVSDSIDVAIKSEYFMNKGCTGAIVGTETLSAKFNAVHNGIADAGVVFTRGTPSVTTRIDLITVRSPAYTMSIEGSGVVRTIKDGRAQWCMTFAAGSSMCVYDNGTVAAEGPTSAGMYASGNKMYTLTPNGSLYAADEVYTKR